MNDRKLCERFGTALEEVEADAEREGISRSAFIRRACDNEPAATA